jgi:hypothetical protein
MSNAALSHNHDANDPHHHHDAHDSHHRHQHEGHWQGNLHDDDHHNGGSSFPLR